MLESMYLALFPSGVLWIVVSLPRGTSHRKDHSMLDLPCRLQDWCKQAVQTSRASPGSIVDRVINVVRILPRKDCFSLPYHSGH
ncbi:hypothetical protein BD309DRAFT_956882 [Dichomitus squalens]|uniref:Uncharacterized protein n=1 Tax=Dichomitus squalens TaxID=114155 RepID=A0A4Q9Q1G8_9APHY|nr:hypothetical protein BD309DRAFT_956882 [Dichomitus squalens]TBU61033.1 hypothetical protein BD310DRAFT_921311 [Dichomitus squalens]